MYEKKNDLGKNSNADKDSIINTFINYIDYKGRDQAFSIILIVYHKIKTFNYEIKTESKRLIIKKMK